MENEMICQSCTMPLENVDDRGTEKDGSKSTEYCRYCYEEGAFVHPNISFEQMKSFISNKMQKMGLPDEVVHQSLKSLPHLKRWRNSLVM